MSSPDVNSRVTPGRAGRPVLKLAVAFVLVACVCGAIGAVAATLVKSPAQVAAEAKPPARTDLTVAIREGSVAQSLTFTGTVTLGNQLTIPTPTTGGMAAVVTKLPLRVGDQFGPGSVLIEVSDRPVIALPGDLPMLRDLQFGDSGPDVARFQDTLRAAGQTIADRPGTFGRSTVKAVAGIYSAAGYSPPLDDSRRARALQSELTLLPNGASGRIVGLGAGLGKLAVDPLVSVTTMPPTVTMDVTQLDLARMAVGDAVELDAAFLAAENDGTIAAIGALEDSQGSGFSAPVVVIPTIALPPTAIGQSVQVTAEADSDEGTGLVVPLSALYSSSDGAIMVELLEGTKKFNVAVSPGASAGGEVVITSKDPRVKAGALVVVGMS